MDSAPCDLGPCRSSLLHLSSAHNPFHCSPSLIIPYMSLHGSQAAGSSSNPDNAPPSSSAPSTSKQPPWPGLTITVPTPIRPAPHSLKRDRSGSLKVPASVASVGVASTQSTITPQTPLQMASLLSTAATMLPSSSTIPESPVPSTPAPIHGPASALAGSSPERQRWKDAIS